MPVPPLLTPLGESINFSGNSWNNTITLRNLDLSWSGSQIILAKLFFLLTCFFIPLSTTLTDIFFSITAVFVLLSGEIWPKRQRLWQNPVVKVLLYASFIVLLGLSYTLAPLGDALLYSKKYLWLILTPILFTLDMDNSFRTCALYSFLAAMLLTILCSFLAYFDFAHLFFIKTTDGIFKDHIIQNFLMSITILICLLQANTPTWQRYLYYGIFLLAAIDILFFCEGRIGYLLLPILIIYAWIANYGWRKLYWPTIIVLLLFGLALLFSNNLQDRLWTTEQNILTYNFFSLSHSDTSLGIRWIMWHLGIKIIAGHPYIGYGTGSIYSILAKIPDSWVVENEWIRHLNTFESAYLHIALQFGMIGLGLFLCAGYYLWKKSSSITQIYYQNLIRGFMLAMIIGFFFNPWLESTTEKHLFALFLVICFSNIEYKKSGNSSPL